MTTHAFFPRPDRPLQIGFLSPHNPYDSRNFSGTPYFALHALEAAPGLSVRVLGDYRPPRLLDKLRRHPSGIPDVGAMDVTGLDAVVGLVASDLLDDLLTRHPGLPALHVTDATPDFLRDAYGWRVPAEADAVETSVAGRAARVIYSSPEIAARAPADLGIPGLRTEVAPFGVNLRTLPRDCPAKPALRPLNLLFVGLDWERKGGDIAVAALDRLRAKGIAAHLTIVGRCPDRHRQHPGITYAGFLNKNRTRDLAKLTRLYTEAHLLLLPSRADCTPMVMAEAMAHGTPVVATDTGGTGSLLGGSGTGRLMPLHATPDDWAEMVTDLTRDPAEYAHLSDASFERARAALSWESWAARIETIARTACEDTGQRRLKVAV